MFRSVRWLRFSKSWLQWSVIGSTLCIYSYYERLTNDVDERYTSCERQGSTVAPNIKKCFQEDILSFLGKVSFLRHNTELKSLDKVNILCLLGPSADKERILPYLVHSQILSIDLLQPGVERVVGDTTCILFFTMGADNEEKKQTQLEQIKYLLRVLATWNCAAMDAVLRKQSFPRLFHRFLLYFRHRLSETAHAVIIFSPSDNTGDVVMQRTIQVALKEGIPLLVVGNDCLESRIQHLSLQVRHFFLQRLVLEHPFVRYLHPFLGQSWIAFFLQLLMAIYYGWKAHSIGYKNGFEDGSLEWKDRWIDGSMMDSSSSRDDELLEFCYGCSSWDRFHSCRDEGMSCLLESLNQLPFLGMSEIGLYKKYVRLLLLNGNAHLVEKLFMPCSQEERIDNEEPNNQLYYFEQGNICIWTLPWTQENISIPRLLRQAMIDWGSFTCADKKSAVWQSFTSWLTFSTYSSSILASRWNRGLYPDISSSNYDFYHRPKIGRFLHGIDGIILPICISKGETPLLKYGNRIIEECLKQQIPIFFVDISNKEHSYPVLSNRLYRAIRRTLIQRAVKIQQEKYISARTQFFLWLYTWRYDIAYIQGYRQAWKHLLSESQEIHSE
ncbi:hypothetical protein GAYE_SCF42G5603 [Galdieria yellowstonensis]|uniref:Uncharacterized protein n=1 Tax=Galdieria yellowstonensis TaxID=3028027 RepID=A0AAV9IKA0_9RHOD|nr:hypothetical protein GAYE_SCF42G5603 [Galdieria yellowstonensis]